MKHCRAVENKPKMAWKRQTSLWLFAIVCACGANLIPSTLAAPAPLTDVSRTTVDVHPSGLSLKSHSPRFTVTVHRVDDLVSESTGAVVAERHMAFEISFDVAYNGGDSLLLNGVPVMAGMDNSVVKMQAAMVIDAHQLGELEAVSGTAIHSPEDAENAAKGAFDVGLATVDVRVQATTTNVRLAPDAPPLPIRRFILSERVVEVNGHSVVQTEFGEQIYFIAPDGRFVGISGEAEWTYVSKGNSAPATDVSNAANAAAHSLLGSEVPDEGCRGLLLPARVANWLENLPSFSRLLVVSFLFALGLAGVCAGTVAVVRLVRSLRKKDSGNADVEKVADAKASHYSYDLVPVSGKQLVSPPSYEALADGAKDGSSENASATVHEKQPGEGETERDSLCQ